jgi:hypothetical protein
MMSIDSSRRFKFLKVNNNSKQAKPLPSASGWALALVKPSDFKRLIPVFACAISAESGVLRNKIRVSERTELANNAAILRGIIPGLSAIAEK